MTRMTCRASNRNHAVALGVCTLVAVTLLLPGGSEGRAKDPVYNQCACRCVAPGDIVGSISHFNNDAGVSCGTYLGKTCNYTNSQTGGVSTGTLKNCGGYKPGGTKALQQTAPQFNAPIMRRGVEGGNSVEAGSGNVESNGANSK